MLGKSQWDEFMFLEPAFSCFTFYGSLVSFFFFSAFICSLVSLQVLVYLSSLSRVTICRFCSLDLILYLGGQLLCMLILMILVEVSILMDVGLAHEE